MPTPYHHGALRSALLAEARVVLAEKGAQAVSLRELARRTGVSHAAPGRHFPDRDALLDAVAADGFNELTQALRTAATEDPPTGLAHYARAHVAFAADNPRLLDLMFSRDLTPDDDAQAQAQDDLPAAAARFFTLGTQLLGEPNPSTGTPKSPLPYLVAATLEGISSLVSNGRLPPAHVDTVVDAAVTMLMLAINSQPAQRP